MMPKKKKKTLLFVVVLVFSFVLSCDGDFIVSLIIPINERIRYFNKKF